MTKLSDWYQQRASNSKEPRSWYRIQNKAGDTATAQIDLYDEISWLWGVSAVDFRNELKSLGDAVKTIELHVNSPGGDVYEAIAIMNTLRQHDARVITTVDGVAASSAGFIAVGASDELIIAENAEIMAHLPWAMTVGNAADMRKRADDLERIGTNIASIFAARAGGSVADWMDVLTNETWWSAQEAVSAGIADKVLPGPKSKNAIAAQFDLSIFAHAGRTNAPAPCIPQAHQTPLPNVEAEETQGKEPLVASLSESALQTLGLDADADEAAIETAIAALADRAAADPEPVEPSLDQAIQIAANADLATISREALEALQVEARAGAEARAQQVRESDERVVDAAIAAGKIAPARWEHHIAALAADRDGHTAVLAALQPGLVPIAEKGHGVTAEITNEDDAVYAALFGKDA